MSLVPNFAQRDGRTGFVFLYDWSSILLPFLIQVMSLVLIFNLEVTLGHTWRCPFLLQCKDLQLPESPRDVSSRGPTWQELGIRLRLVFKEVMKDLLIQLLKMLLTYGMAKGNRTTVDIHFLWIDSQLFHLKSSVLRNPFHLQATDHSKGLGCKGLIELPEVDLVNCPASFCKSGSYCGDRSSTHESRFNTWIIEFAKLVLL